MYTFFFVFTLIFFFVKLVLLSTFFAKQIIIYHGVLLMIGRRGKVLSPKPISVWYDGPLRAHSAYLYQIFQNFIII